MILVRQAQRSQEELEKRSMKSIFSPIPLEIIELALYLRGRRKRYTERETTRAPATVNP
jgi:hypothetical protein